MLIVQIVKDIRKMSSDKQGPWVPPTQSGLYMGFGKCDGWVTSPNIKIITLCVTHYVPALEWVLSKDELFLTSLSLWTVLLFSMFSPLQTVVIFDSSPLFDVLKQLLNSMDSFFSVCITSVLFLHSYYFSHMSKSYFGNSKEHRFGVRQNRVWVLALPFTTYVPLLNLPDP